MKSKLHDLYFRVQIFQASRRISQLSSRIILAMLFCCLLAGQSYAQVGTWTAVTNQAPDPNNGVMVLLTDGRVMCHTTAGGTQGDGTIWDILTPDSTGSYVNGTWTQSAGMTQERYSFPAVLLNNGNVYAAGGEYGTDGTQAGWHVEVYNPLTNVWTEATGTTSAKTISDGSCNILDNGDVLQALVDVSMPVHVNFYTPSTNAMTSAPSTLHGQNESMWLKLPDNSILFVDEGATTSERYIPSLNQWVADGNVPVSLYDPTGYECGPAWMLPNGKAFFVGGTNTAAIYTPSGTNAAGSWVSAAAMPNGYGMPDAPGAMMPNGKILLAGSPQPTASNEFNTPTEFFEYNYLTNSYATVTAPNTSAASGAISQQYNMLVLPTGQVLLGMDQDNTSAQYYVYNPTGTPLDTGKPIINQIIPLSCTTYMAIGHRFNGISSGAAFGDENENDENYPLFRFQTASGRVYYARSYNWNSRGVQRGLTKIDTAYFEIPATMPTGAYNLYCVSVGIPSDPFPFTSAIASLSSPVSNSICSGSTFTYTPTSTTPGATFTWTRPAVTGISNAAITTPQSTNPNETLINTTGLPITVNYVYSVTGGGCSNTENVAVSVNPAPIASFTGSPVTSCILPDSVTFTNTTIAGTSYVWSFGDGGTSTVTSPVHAYTAGGSYSVKLVATSACGVDSVTSANYIVVTAPSGPTVAALTPHCGSTSFTLTANTSNHVAWFDSTGTFLSSANPYTTPVLTTTKTFYVQDSVPAAIDSVGPATYTTLGAGGNFGNTNQHYLTFDALSNFTLISVVVEASTAGVRTIQLINSGGTVIATANPNIPTGVSTVTLNFSVPQGTGYELSCGGTGTTNIELYRNNAVAAGAYPFTIPNIVSITGNDVGTGYYYYFYDWKVQAAPCVSARTAVTAVVHPAVTAAAHVQEVACYGGATGADTAVVTGGTQAFSYKWSTTPTQTSQIITGLTPGTYTVTVTDANQCTATATSTVTQPTAALSVQGTVTNPTCGSPSSGKVVLTVSGGTTAYTYLWNTTPSQSTGTATNLAAGSYSVTVTDAHSCSTTATYTVAAPTSGLTLATDSVNASCGNSNGSATVSVTPNTGSFTYAWSAGGSTTATDANIAAGSYSVTVTSTSSGCSASATVHVNSTGGATLTPTTTPTTCGLNNGSARVVPTGGTAPFTYTWNNSLTDSSITGLASGTYTVTVRDANGCASIASLTVGASSGVSLTPSATSTTCGLNNGTASVTVANPSSPTYLWNTSATTSQITGLASGTYTVTVHNAGCSATATASVAASTAPSLTPSSTSTTCGLNNGTASVSVINPNNASYHWNTNATTSQITGLASGTYTVTVNNAGCSATASVSVGASSALSLTPSSTATTCGSANGIASVSVANPSSPTYLWNTNATTSQITGLASGTYTVTVNNAGCSATASVSVAGSSGVSYSTSSTPTTCGSNNGGASVSVTNPNGPTYVWNTNATSASITGVGSGNYTVTVTNNGCSAVATVSVASSTPLILNSSVNATTCGLNNGTAAITFNNPISSPTYTWNTSATTDSIGGLASGSYSVTVTNGGCTASTTVTIATSVGTTFTTSTTATTCGNANGSATASLTSIAHNPTYMWNNNGNTATINGLASGTYTVTVTNNGCSATASVSVAPSTGLSISTSSTAAVCIQQNGTATVSETNPVSPTYAWSNNGTTAQITGLAAGIYTVTVTDAGCSSTLSVTVAQSSGTLSSIANHTSEPCYGEALAQASVTASGGTPNYSYAWSNNQSGASISGLTAGTYIVSVTDQAGCLSADTVVVTQPAPVHIVVSSTNITAQQTLGSATVDSITGGTTPYTVSWSNGVSGVNDTSLPAGTYVATVTDSNGCKVTDTVKITKTNGIVTVDGGIAFSIYPNPARTEVVVSLHSTYTDAVVSLTDVLGMTLVSTHMTASPLTMDLTPYSSGIYFIEVSQGGVKSVRKLIVTK